MSTQTKQLKFLAGEWTQTVVQKSNGILLLCKKEQTTDTHSELDESPETESTIPKDNVLHASNHTRSLR